MIDEEQIVKIKNTVSQIKLISIELQAYFKDDQIFVNPEQKFKSLLLNLISLLDEDGILLQFSQCDLLYTTYKQKYEDASELVIKLTL